MDHDRLRTHIRALVELPENRSPIVSTYVDLTRRLESELELTERSRVIQRTLDEPNSQDFMTAFGRIEGYLANLKNPRAEGVAIFARDGDEPFFLAFEFEVAFPTELSVDTVPNIYRLMELKDNYDRYVVMISGERDARILEVSLGSVTRQLWTERPELRERVGREWTKQHYQNHRENRTDQFIKEKIRILDELVNARGHTHLILAGHPTMTARVQKELPRHLLEKVVDLIPVSTRAKARDVVRATLASFVETEEKQSLEYAKLLEAELLSSSGLAVAGVPATREALENGQADVVIIGPASDSPPEIREQREELARLAERTGAQFEVVADGRALRRMGGVGCLLRFQTQHQPAPELV